MSIRTSAFDAALARVFGGLDHRRPFALEDRAALLVHPIDYVWLTPEQFEAVAKAARQSGDDRAWIAGYSMNVDGPESIHACHVVSLTAPDEYLGHIDGPFAEHILLPQSASWGVYTSDGNYAAVAGAPAFIDGVRAALPTDEDEMLQAFLAEWREEGEEGSATDWIEPLLSNLFGSDRAREALASTGLT